jgi:rhodanese-related sulfurtransferase
MEAYETITFAQAHQLLEQEPDCMILDVREEEEYITGHADGAVLFPLDTIDAQSAAGRIPRRDTPVLVYCRSGRRSRQAAERLAALGYTRVYDMGSLVGWPYGLAW